MEKRNSEPEGRDIWTELEELRDWKTQMTTIDSRCDWQELAKLLGLVPGQEVRSNIIPKIRELIAVNEFLVQQLKKS